MSMHHQQIERTGLAAIGDNTVDQYFGAEQTSFVGGNAVNVAVKLRTLGDDVAYAGAVGADADGERIRSTLDGEGVDTSLLVELPGITSVSRIRVEDDGERDIFFEDFATSADYQPSDADLDVLGRRRLVHIGMNPFADRIRRELRARGVIVTQDCAVSAGYDDLDVAFCSAGDDRAAAERLAREAVAGGAALAVVTCGPAGSIAHDGERWWQVPAEPLEVVVDTTGAGDSYIAGFVHRFAQGADVETCMIEGSRVAALTCQHWGGFEQVPQITREGAGA
jgi:fructoselysine 6-kinase